MIKQFKNIIISPLFIICFVGSIIALVFNYFNYNNSDFDHHTKYSITYHENIEEYDEEIDYYKNVLDKLPKKERNYDEIKKNCEDIIKIYEELKNNNVDYKLVNDTFINEYDSTIFLINTRNIMLPIILINLIVIIYLIFTREFDNSRYVFIYGENRNNIIRNKLIVSFILSISLFLIYSLLNFIFASKFDSIYQYILTIEDSATFIKTGEYVFKYIFIYTLYNLLFFFLLFFGISLFTRKSLFSAIGIGLVVSILAFLASFSKVLCYIGISIDFEIVPHNLYFLTLLFIIIPIGLLIYGVLNFRKCDL